MAAFVAVWIHDVGVARVPKRVMWGGGVLPRLSENLGWADSGGVPEIAERVCNMLQILT